ncbi:hypothetical protein PV11_03746 [Exophiala sideris]|uniref:Zinc finger PHD-type domain-containing protein n=1 Tax=Exophiala sideris TaxID=1016849 RepID=A0A0D1X254_9EURO|nr:hypothetical protein PV11_03746 [Exophiala sideris]
MAELDPTDLYMRSRGDDWVYLCDDTHPTSYSGCVDDASAISEQEVAEFVRYSNPELFKKLKGVRVASSHLRSDDEVEDAAADEQGQAVKVDSQLRRTLSQHDTTKAASTEESPSAIKEAGLPLCTASEGAEELDDTEHFVMLDEHCVFSLKYHTDPDVTYYCSYPTCQHTMNIIPLGDIYGVYQTSNGNSALHPNDPTAVLFCQNCIQELLKRAEEGQTHEIPPQFVDGSCDRQFILKAAEKIHPSLTPKQSFFSYLPEGPTLEPGEGSNSVKGLRRRRQKQYEIDGVLRRLREDHHLRNLRRMHKRQVKPAQLRIQTPFDIEPYRERYKKQGLEWSDRTEQDGERRASKTSSTHEEVARDIVDGSVEDNDASTCYCGEPNDSRGMVQCSSNSCMFGRVHLRCSGLSKMLDVSERYLCHNCTGGDPVVLRRRRTQVLKDRRQSNVLVSEGDLSMDKIDDSSMKVEEVRDEPEGPQRRSEWVAVNTSKPLPMR